MQPAQSNLMMQEKACHEIAVGSDEAMNDDELAQSIVNRAEAGCNTARVQTSEKMIDTCVTTHEMSSQAHAATRDMGCDGRITQMQNQAS